ncbi:MAG: Lrp/AsnC family transcriptional regulator [Candidatus Kapabacteria bacterium]|nr:Lrp/AsnC family transcriptional regulator [Candidatus Kapabacteria bacterium]
MLKDVDRQICALLQENARMSFSDIAERVGLSTPSVSEHVRKLEESGLIRGYGAVLDPSACGADVTAFIFVDIDSSANYDLFRRNCRQRKDVMECHAITGTASHLIKARVKNTASLEQLLSAIQQWKGVTRTMTNVVLSSHKETMAFL